jgi:N-acetylmuramoyl-L-alanine amidase
MWCMAIFVTGIMLNGVFSGGAAAEEGLAQGQKKTIVFDPGHGGYDMGVKGSDGTLEKTVTLTLARMIEEVLEKKYAVRLSRMDDYDVDITERTAVANHLKADLFISIHTGGSSARKISGISVFCFSKKWDPVLNPETGPIEPPEGGDASVPWDQIQYRHKAASSILAKRIGKRLADRVEFSEVRIQGAPILVLEGADMPAVLIEIGYLTNPADEKKLMDKSILHNVAQAVGNGIDDFFTNQQGLSAATTDETPAELK